MVTANNSNAFDRVSLMVERGVTLFIQQDTECIGQALKDGHAIQLKKDQSWVIAFIEAGLAYSFWGIDATSLEYYFIRDIEQVFFMLHNGRILGISQIMENGRGEILRDPRIASLYRQLVNDITPVSYLKGYQICKGFLKDGQCNILVKGIERFFIGDDLAPMNNYGTPYRFDNESDACDFMRANYPDYQRVRWFDVQQKPEVATTRLQKTTSIQMSIFEAINGDG